MTDTGFPILPEGYFWRVSRDSDWFTGKVYGGLSGLRVSIYKRGKTWWGKSTEKYVESATVPRVQEIGNEQVLLRMAAESALRKLSESTNGDQHIGDYPPKRLDTLTNT